MRYTNHDAQVATCHCTQTPEGESRSLGPTQKASRALQQARIDLPLDCLYPTDVVRLSGRQSLKTGAIRHAQQLPVHAIVM